ncbi:MAG: hypothetical protein ACKO7R_02160 [Pseudanabaena sp.]
MTITLSVEDFINRKKYKVKTDQVFFLSGLLWLDEKEARLYNWQDDQSIPFADDETYGKMRSHFSGDYLGEALLQTWVRDRDDWLEIYHVYWVAFKNKDQFQWSDKISVRPVPPQYESFR